MFLIYKLLRGMVKAIFSEAAPWQVAIGAFLGTALGFLAIWPLAWGPAPLGLGLLLIALVVNCHLGSVFAFMLVGKLVSLALMGPAVALGTWAEPLAQWCAQQPVLFQSRLSNTGYLGLALIGACLAPLSAILMLRLTLWVRSTLAERIKTHRKLMKAGKLADKQWLMRALCWFMGV